MAKRKEKAVIVKQEMIVPGVYSLWVKTSFANEAKAGQFLGVYLDDKSKPLMRPISICDVNREEGLLRMVYRAVGEGTKELSGYEAGKEIWLLGVLGNGYDFSLFENKRLIIIGGGIGIPPMLLAAKSFEGEKTVVLGYSDGNLFLEDEFTDAAETFIATVDGSVGTKGTVLDCIAEEELSGDVIIACGPMPMLSAIKKYAAEHNMEAYISLEERMACGVGACLGCVCKTVNKDHHTHVFNTRICVEGPVFDSREVDI